MNKVISFYNKTIGQILSPPFCEFCKDFIEERTIFCKKCFDKIKPVVSARLAITPTQVLKVYAISNYKDPPRSLILAKKWSNQLASKQLAQLIWDMTNIKNIDFDLIVPIPLHWTRYIKRGFNQSQVIANEISKKSNKPLENILKRVKKTDYQLFLTAQERLINVKDAFQLKENNNIYQGKHLLIVDDLLTSGATLKAAAKELLKLKPAQISAVVACRVV
jgi:competence protein ComFC